MDMVRKIIPVPSALTQSRAAVILHLKKTVPCGLLVTDECQKFLSKSPFYKIIP